jgi:hypothetical protein
MIYTDRTRFTQGCSCEWKRLIGFHWGGCGLSRKLQIAPLATGIAVHSALEAILRAWKDAQRTLPQFDYPAIIGPAVDRFREIVTERGLENYNTEEAHYQVALAQALPLAYARVCEDWFREEFELLAVEDEMPLQVDESLMWQTRSDFITYVKTMSTYAVHDFKTASAWYPDNVTLWQDNLQQMVNGYAAGKRMGVPVTHYYIHILVKGSKRSPSPIVMPWYQPANPPMQIEDVAFRYKYVDQAGKNRYLGRSYERTLVSKFEPDMGKWIKQGVPMDVLQDSIVVIGPFGIDNVKVEKFLHGLPRHEQTWTARMEEIEDMGVVSTSDWEKAWPTAKFQNHLDRSFTRTYDCFQFGGQKCAYYNLCHNKPGWDNPIGNGEYEPRTPHHSTEEI